MAVKGLNETLQMLTTLEKDLQEDIKYEIEKGTETIFKEARKLLLDGGNQFETSRRSVSKKTTTLSVETITGIDQFLNYEITNNGYLGSIYIPELASVLSMYIEFGTGQSAAGYVPTLPPEVQVVALSYFINGKGTLIKRPFLMPAYFNNYGKILLAMKAAFEKRGVKVNVIN